MCDFGAAELVLGPDTFGFAMASTVLLVSAALVSLLLFWPRDGLLWKWLQGREAAERISIEDALKHFYNFEYAHLAATVASLAGVLQIGRDDAAQLAGRLESLGLVTLDADGIRLTAEGRSYALRVIRVHRLWERFLADRTGVSEAQWHHQADRKEHHLTPEQVETLAAELGHPVFDPHGDPIPTSDGEMPARQGMPLSALDAGATARIIHVEDEPDAVYAQLVAARLYPGITIRVLEKTRDRLRIEADLQEHVLAPVVASNLTVQPIGDALDARAPDRRLSSLSVGQEALVVDISPACRGIERRRLLDLGVVPGTRVRAELESAGGDPVAYRIRGAMIALRRDQADYIYVQSHASDGLSTLERAQP
jgi:DtxR family transcriptional regulator, Mn-dependent transcriptional regulator